jgi:hypothetical protein
MPDAVALPLTGGCGCGAVRFEVAAPLAGAIYCHCTRCRRRTGTAAAPSALTQRGSFRVVEGHAHLRRWSPGDGFDKVFCGACGSALWAQDPGDADVVAVRMGAFDADPGVRPTARQFTAYAAPWEPIPDDGLPRHLERMAR